MLRAAVGILIVGAITACESKSARDVPRDGPAASTTRATVTGGPPETPPSTTDAAVEHGGAACGDVTCGAGETCCNASCSICVPAGGSCIQQHCDPKPKPTPKQSAAPCTSDADCSTRASYCGDAPCACVVVAKGAPPPTCTKGTVQCFADPCRSKAARCQSGACVLTMK